MVKDGRVSHGKRCLGAVGGTKTRKLFLKCTLARNGSGSAILLCRNCPHCGEQRCRFHCKCARNKTSKAKGRCAPRGRRPEAKSSVAVRPSAAAASSARAPAPSCSLLDVGTWYRAMLSDIRTASTVELATYMYDNPSLQALLLKRLNDPKPFKLNVYIDAEMFAGEVPRYQKSRLRSLHEAGASIYVCRGSGPHGAFHGKAVVIDKMYLYTGSPNLTQKSEVNDEMPFRICGPAVGQVYKKLEEKQSKSRLWNGS